MSRPVTGLYATDQISRSQKCGRSVYETYRRDGIANVTPAPKVLVLDAMGVVYQVGDDVADLLAPFILENGGSPTTGEIESAYMEASLGRINANEFWNRVGILPEREDGYLTRVLLTDGLREFLSAAPANFQRVVCLSNDVSQWSRKLRRMHQLETHIDGWFRFCSSTTA